MLATYTGYVIGQFKLRYPHVHSMGDAGAVLFGPFGMDRFGREFLGTGQLLFLVFIMGSHLLTFTVMMNTLTDHATCSIVFGVVGLVVSFIFALPRTLKKVSWFSFACMRWSFVGEQTLLLILFSDSLREYCRCGTYHYDCHCYSASTKWQAKCDYESKCRRSILVRHKYCLRLRYVISHQKSVCTLTNLSVAGHVAFFGFISEMAIPTDYPKTLYMLQTTDTTLYVVAAVVIYIYGGKDVKSPALSSTSDVTAKLAYGIAIPSVGFIPFSTVPYEDPYF